MVRARCTSPSAAVRKHLLPRQPELIIVIDAEIIRILTQFSTSRAEYDLEHL